MHRGWYLAQLTIARARALVRSVAYLVSAHAAEELEDDNRTIRDLVAKLSPTGRLFIIAVYLG